MMIRQSLLAFALGFLIGTAALAIYQVAEFGRVKPRTVIISLLCVMAASIAKAMHLGIKKPRSIRQWRKFDGTPVYAERNR